MRHDFYAWDFGFMQTQWKCEWCGMKVPSAYIARRLQGQRCYG